MNGDRFKKRLPKFLGKISDFEDLLIAEDKEFDKIDSDLNRFDKGLFINTLNDMENPEEYLKRLEKDYGLPSIGSYKERINAILVKKRAKEPTTPFRVEELGNNYSNVDDIVNFIPQYEEYSFIVEFLLSRGKTDIQGFLNGLEEIKPAHLEVLIRLILEHKLIIKDKTDDYLTRHYFTGEHNTGTIPKHQYTGVMVRENVNIPNTNNTVEQRTFNVNEISSGGDSR